MGLLYSHATVAVLPSRYEGFGLGVLDAMNSKCPVICYKNSSIPEVAGTAAVMLRDGSSLAPPILQIATDSNLRRKLVAMGIKQSSKFSWKTTATLTKEIIERSVA
jgi:glycosyltransferase involved in cell wall biosynthesis